jgi:ATP-dependent RNA helicase DeaD
MAWFRLNLGREKNADPRWLIPLLCRRGDITKAEIGKIQIFATETRVAIVARAAERFASLARRPDPKDRSVTIEPFLERGGDRPPKRRHP